MKKIALAILLALSVFVWAKDAPNPSDYTVNVHVIRSRNMDGPQRLDVLIDGKKYELKAYGPLWLLALGDYKAKVIKDEHRGAYDNLKVYEFLFPDHKTRKFVVVGERE